MKSTNYSHNSDNRKDIEDSSRRYSASTKVAQPRNGLGAEKLRLARFGLQVKAWRLRAGMTQTEAGLRLADDAGEMKHESAKRLWIRIEKGVSWQNTEKLRRITDIVRGTHELAQALQDGCFEINSDSVFRDYVKNSTDQSGHSLSETLSDSPDELREFLKNGENRGTTLMYLLGQREKKSQLQRDKVLLASHLDLSLKVDEITFEDGRNRVVEELFSEHILIPKEENYRALNDLWLSIFRNGEAGIAYLTEIEKIYSKCCGMTKNVNSYIYKHSIHLASQLLFHLYDCQRDQTNLLINKSAKRKSALGTNGLRFESIEALIELIPWKNRRGIKEEFAEFLYSSDTFLDVDDIGSLRDEATPKEFEASVLNFIRQISHLEFENEHNPLSDKRSVRKYALYRLYNEGTPQEFLSNLWLLLDTFELYKIKFQQVFPGKRITFVQC